MRAYYNENDAFAAAWLRELIAQGLIATGVVDERDVRDVQPSDLVGFDRCHFFAGIGGWDLALQFVGWDSGRSIWTGSCPCQPFSSAGKGRGFDDSRHLWPAWFRLIRECRPAVVFGEQVASVKGLAWFDHVAADLETEAYAVGSADLCAAGVGSLTIRQRLFFVAVAVAQRERDERDRELERQQPRQLEAWPAAPGGRMADSAESRCAGRIGETVNTSTSAEPNGLGTSRTLGDTAGDGRSERGLEEHAAEQCSSGLSPDRSSTRGPWDGAIPVLCRDGKVRLVPIEPSVQPLAPRLPGRVGLLRGSGNSIVPQAAAAFIRAYLETEGAVIDVSTQANCAAPTAERAK